MIQDVNLKGFTDLSNKLLKQKQEKEMAQPHFFEGRAWSVHTKDSVMLLPVLSAPWGWWLLLRDPTQEFFSRGFFLFFYTPLLASSFNTN